jgi:hypothetical protein
VTPVDGAGAAPARPALVRPGSRGAPDPALRTLRSVRRELLLDGRSSLRFASAARGECGIPHRVRIKTPRWSAAGRASRSQGTRRRKASTDWLRLSALHPLGLYPRRKKRPATGRRRTFPGVIAHGCCTRDRSASMRAQHATQSPSSSRKRGPITPGLSIDLWSWVPARARVHSLDRDDRYRHRSSVTPALLMIFNHMS